MTPIYNFLLLVHWLPVKYLQNIKLGKMKQVFTAINGILIVKLERIDTKI